ncbi:MAG: helix-turn-helix domain-containing protein [Gemmatimonadaceae bacterium]
MRVRTRKDLGLLIREARAKRQMTQAQLAQIVGVNRRWVVQIETAKTSADMRTLLRALRALGLEMHVRQRAVSAAEVEIATLVDPNRRRRE